MATENILMAAVGAAVIGKSRTSGSANTARPRPPMVKQHGQPNDLFNRWRGDSAFSQIDRRTALTDARQFVGRAPEQVDEFLAEVVEPLLSCYTGSPVRRRGMPV